MVEAPPAVARPEGCRDVVPGDDVQRVLDDPSVAAVCLARGRYAGPLVLRRAVTLWGPPTATIHAERPGSAVEIVAPGAALRGVAIDGRGGRYDQSDAAVHVTTRDVRVEGVTVTDAMFGILVEHGQRVVLIGNTIHGGHDPALGLRGDTIRLWETTDSVVVDNTVLDGRDIVVWYSSRNRIANNRVEGGRYGAHFMYSHDNELVANRFTHGVVGVFVMYSRGLVVRDNVIAGAAGAAGMAIGLKESGNIEVTGNLLVRDAIGIYIDASPLQLTDRVLIARNELRLDDRGIVFHASGHRVDVTGNDFADNLAQVEVDGGGDALDVSWRGNYFDDYEGYDLDDDGTGDVPYEQRSASDDLASTHAEIGFFRGTPALALVDAAAHLDPLYRPRALLSDPAPRMEPVREASP